VSWLNVSERVEAADGRRGEVTGIANLDGDQVVQIEYDDGQRTGWLWASQFRQEGES
jgi:hypothetical protein